MSETYPKDEFDDLPHTTPAGVHRASRNPWAPVLPFLLVLIFVPLLAWGVATLIQRNVPQEDLVEVLTQSEATQSTGETVTEEVVEEEVILPESDLPTAAPDDPSQAPDEGNVTEPEVASPVDFGAAVAVLNGTGIDGYAGQTANRVAEAGFTNVYPGNANTWPTDQNTVFYPSAELRSTAESIANTLGFNAAEGGFEEAPGAVVVFLAN